MRSPGGTACCGACWHSGPRGWPAGAERGREGAAGCWVCTQAATPGRCLGLSQGWQLAGEKMACAGVLELSCLQFYEVEHSSWFSMHTWRARWLVKGYRRRPAAGMSVSKPRTQVTFLPMGFVLGSLRLEKELLAWGPCSTVRRWGLSSRGLQLNYLDLWAGCGLGGALEGP